MTGKLGKALWALLKSPGSWPILAPLVPLLAWTALVYTGFRLVARRHSAAVEFEVLSRNGEPFVVDALNLSADEIAMLLESGGSDD